MGCTSGSVAEPDRSISARIDPPLPGGCRLPASAAPPAVRGRPCGSSRRGRLVLSPARCVHLGIALPRPAHRLGERCRRRPMGAAGPRRRDARGAGRSAGAHRANRRRDRSGSLRELGGSLGPDRPRRGAPGCDRSARLLLRGGAGRTGVGLQQPCPPPAHSVPRRNASSR